MKKINCFRFFNYFRVYISFGRRSVLDVHESPEDVAHKSVDLREHILR